MNKRKILYIIALFIIISCVIVYMYNKQYIVSDYKKAEFMIEGQSVVIDEKNYFGNELFTDLNGDGREDVVFLITQSPGGSGTFFYVVGALNTEKGYIGSDGYLLGDRIAPQTTENSRNPRHKNVIVVNYADRRFDEPMTTSPSIGKSAYLKLVPETMQWAIVEPDFEGESR